ASLSRPSLSGAAVGRSTERHRPRRRESRYPPLAIVPIQSRVRADYCSGTGSARPRCALRTRHGDEKVTPGDTFGSSGGSFATLRVDEALVIVYLLARQAQRPL